MQKKIVLENTTGLHTSFVCLLVRLALQSHHSSNVQRTQHQSFPKHDQWDWHICRPIDPTARHLNLGIYIYMAYMERLDVNLGPHGARVRVRTRRVSRAPGGQRGGCCLCNQLLRGLSGGSTSVGLVHKIHPK